MQDLDVEEAWIVLLNQNYKLISWENFTWRDQWDWIDVHIIMEKTAVIISQSQSTNRSGCRIIGSSDRVDRTIRSIRSDKTDPAPSCPATDFILEDVRQKVETLDVVKSSSYSNRNGTGTWWVKEAKMELGFIIWNNANMKNVYFLSDAHLGSLYRTRPYLRAPNAVNFLDSIRTRLQYVYRSETCLI